MYIVVGVVVYVVAVTIYKTFAIVSIDSSKRTGP